MNFVSKLQDELARWKRAHAGMVRFAVKDREAYQRDRLALRHSELIRDELEKQNRLLKAQHEAISEVNAKLFNALEKVARRGQIGFEMLTGPDRIRDAHDPGGAGDGAQRDRRQVTKPIKPGQVVKKIPPEVIEVVNEMIQEGWDGASVTIKQDPLVARIAVKLNVPRQTIFDKGWLDFESLFEKEGWRVTYDKPAYCENYEAFFRFQKKTARLS